MAFEMPDHSLPLGNGAGHLEAASQPWWSRRSTQALLIVLMAVPFVATPLVPLFDLPGHMGRFHIEADGGRSLYLHRWWDFHWALIGNLGVDLLVVPLSHGLGIEQATRIVVAAIPVLTAAGFLFVARERHGTLPPTAALALPLALGYPFQFGFVNFALAMAMAFLAFGLWLRLERLGQTRLRFALFLVIAPIVWIAHVFGWAVLCILCFAAALHEAVETRQSLLAVPGRIALRCLPLCIPILIMLLWRSGLQAETQGFFDMRAKLGWLLSALRDHWKGLDGDSVEALLAFAVIGVAGFMRVDRVLGLATLLLGIVYLALPGTLVGLIYADMRLAPYLIAMTLLSFSPRRWMPHWLNGTMAAVALLFVLMRLTATTISSYHHAEEIRTHLAAIDHMPRGARAYSLVAPPCERGWDGPRLDHFPSLAIVRRDAFTNDQWTAEGAQLVRVRLPIPADYASTPSQIVRLDGCARPEPLLSERIATFPRDQFDMVWLINVPARARPTVPWLTLLWADTDDALYAIDRPSQP